MDTQNAALSDGAPGNAASAGGSANIALYRSRTQRVVAGVAGGLGERLGVDPVLVRIAFAMLTLSGFAGLILYVVLWVVVPESDGSVEVRPPGARRAAAMAMVVLGLMVILRPMGLWLGNTAAASLSLAALGAAVIWASSPEATRQRWSRNLSERPLDSLDATSRFGRLRLLVGALFFAGGALLFLQRTDAFAAAPGVVLAVAATMAGLAILFGPWAWRLVGQLTEERRERIRSQERAEMAAHLHDSVLQTLALIQRTDQPREMVALARNQERELRAWLNGTPAHRNQMLSGAIEEAASAVELQFKVPVEVVTVGDAPMDERLQAVVDACREATVNAAKHSGAGQVSVYMEVEPDTITTFIRDDGAGFDPQAVAGDRRGIAESIKGRMERSGGTASIVTEPGGGTEVQLTMARTR
ncbi:MAG TPA: PspC domain-containing protein [Actinomycetota bacterium]|nr:PspC domain-containing protein [Actinomycetota bacterium]